MQYSNNMDGGYINEGGQLKSKNGQKYVINQRRDGVFVSKGTIAILSLIILLIMLAIFLLTYFLHPMSCMTAKTNGNDVPSKAGIFNHNNNNNAEISPPLTSTTASSSAASAAATTTWSSAMPSTTMLPPTIVDEKNIDVLLANGAVNEAPNDDIVLYEGWNPIIYRILMEPNYSLGQTNGKLSIDIEQDKNEMQLQPIVFDIKNITIYNVIVFQNDLNVPLDIHTFYGKNNETYVINIKNGLQKTLDPIMLTIKLQFISSLTDTLQGFYRTSYEDSYTGKQEWLASTQFSPIDARRAFPCFDRPDKKAQFQISIIREATKSMVLSNMQSSFITFPKDGYVQEDFDVTPKMSTYLVAFIVSDLVNSNVSINHSTESPIINIWTRKEVSDMTSYVYKLTTKILPYFEKYFGLRYSLPKIDMVAVPDFGFSAMENWGLITFRESAMLVPEDEERKSSAEHTERVSSVLAHEIAHSWFGNLVTMKWWDDLWLKEGFATYMSYLALDHIEPTWHLMDFFPINEIQNSMKIDSDKSSHPISFSVSKLSDIRRIFDPISYSKGASIIRMMNGFLGEKTFRGGMQHFLKKFQYSNAAHDDLWNILTEFGHNNGTLLKEYDVKTIMDTWTLQPGYPVLTITRINRDVLISQHRYMLPKIIANDPQRWFIPITFETKKKPITNQIPTYWLPKLSNLTIENIIESQDDWLYVNVNRSGYYRVNYDWNSWTILSRNFNQLPPSTRAQLVDDSLHLAKAELVSYDIPLTFLISLGTGADDILSWAASNDGLEYLNTMLIREPAYGHFRAIMRYIVKPVYDKLGFDEQKGESHVDLMHRQRIIHHACFFGYDRCTNRAQILFREWMREKTLNLARNNNNSQQNNNTGNINSRAGINPNLKEIIYCIALREGSFQEWYFSYNRYLETTSASEKELILSALGCTTKPWLLSKYLNMTLSPTSGIRKQDGARVFASIATNNIGYEIAFDFLVTNIKEIHEYFGDGFSTISKMIYSVTSYMNKDYQKDQFEKFAKKSHDLGLPAIERIVESAMEQVKNNIFWRSRSYYKLQEFLETLASQLHINLY